jgi:hypothetical protein
MSRRTRSRVGDIVEIPLRSGRRAYGRVLRDASIAVYEGLEFPHTGSRDFQFVVGIYDDALRKLPVVGHDPSLSEDDDWPPPQRVTDKITGRSRLYVRGEIVDADEAECEGLEPAAVWDLHHIVERIESPS